MKAWDIPSVANIYIPKVIFRSKPCGVRKNSAAQGWNIPKWAWCWSFEDQLVLGWYFEEHTKLSFQNFALCIHSEGCALRNSCESKNSFIVLQNKSFKESNPHDTPLFDRGKELKWSHAGLEVIHVIDCIGWQNAAAWQIKKEPADVCSTSGVPLDWSLSFSWTAINRPVKLPAERVDFQITCAHAFYMLFSWN